MCPVNLSINMPVFASHKRTVLSWLALANVVPSGLNTTLSTQPLWLGVFIDVPIFRFHKYAFLPAPLTSVVLFGLKAILLTDAASPVIVFLSSPVFASHNRTVLSWLALASVVLSGLNTTLVVTSSIAGSISVSFNVPVFASHNRTVLSWLALASVKFPSGLNTTLQM